MNEKVHFIQNLGEQLISYACEPVLYTAGA